MEFSTRCLVILMFFGCQAFSQTAKRVCPTAGTVVLTAAFNDSYDSATLAYELSEPKAFSSARMEVWDRPKLLFRTQVPVQSHGQIVWTPKQEPADTPLALWIRVGDPRFPSDGSESTAMVGTTGPDEGGPVPELIRQSFVIEEGIGSPTVTVTGKNLGEHNTRIMLLEEESPQVRVVREYLPTVLVDLEHISVQIPSGYLLKPTVLQLEAVRTGGESGYQVGMQAGGNFWCATIHVTSKNSPDFSSIEPSRVSAGQQGGAAVRIFGSGFTNDSEVLVSVGGGIDFSSTLQPVFISSSELQVTLRDDQLRRGRAGSDTDLQLWVRNGDDQHISAPQTLTLMPTDEYPRAGARRPSIISISPYPIPLMDQRSSADLLLKVYGENFKKGDTVIANNGESQAGDGKLRTEFISSQQLNAWLPQELWRHHQLSFRLVTQTSRGRCAVEVLEEQ